MSKDLKKTFETQVKIRFAHCDPAGIIFYPRYFEILNSVVEDWFALELGCSFNQLINQYQLGTPMVDIQTKFHKPCMLDDILSMQLTLEKLGNSSAIINVTAKIKDALYIHSRGVLVCSKLDLTSAVDWPNSVAENMKTFT